MKRRGANPVEIMLIAALVAVALVAIMRPGQRLGCDGFRPRWYRLVPVEERP